MDAARPVRYLGLDPGLQVTGYAVLAADPRGPRILEAGVVRSATSGRDTTDISRRVAILYEGIVEVFDQWQPTSVAVEQLFAHYDHPRTAVLMAHARGVLLLAAGLRGTPVTSIAPARVKKTITGSGRATKEQMQMAVMRELGLAQPPQPADVADAVGVALCLYHRERGVKGLSA